MQKLNLAGSWEFREKGRGNWETGKVPGSLFKDLLQADRIPDPFYRDNSDEIKKLDFNTRSSILGCPPPMIPGSMGPGFQNLAKTWCQKI